MIFEAINCVFWWALYGSLKFLKYVFLTYICSDALVKAEMLEFLEEDCYVKVTMASDVDNNMDNENKKNDDADKNKKYACEIIVNNPKFFRRIAQDDFMALGESYMEGWFECENVDALIGAIANGYEEAYPIVKFMMKAEDHFAGSTNNQTKEKSVQVVEEHYNLGNDLYELMLDPSMNYTCAYWKEDTKTLEEAQINKMDLIARKLNLKPGMKVLDIGSGFGAMAKYLAKNYKVAVTCYNISTEQVKYAKENCKGLDVTFIMEDYRNATGKFDRIYSIGFFEAVGVQNFHEYFELCHRCLKDDGLTLLHSITFNESHAYPSRNPRWLDKYIFPGGELPYTRDYLTYSKDLFLVEDMHSLGRSYAKTLHAWKKTFISNWDKHLKAKYESQQGGKFYRMWIFYLMSCAGLFENQAIQLHQIVFAKNGRKGEYKQVR